MFITCIGLNFGSFIIVSLNFEGVKKKFNATAQVMKEDNKLINLLPFFCHHHKKH
jgi:hypothetical protein